MSAARAASTHTATSSRGIWSRYWPSAPGFAWATSTMRWSAGRNVRPVPSASYSSTSERAASMAPSGPPWQPSSPMTQTPGCPYTDTTVAFSSTDGEATKRFGRDASSTSGLSYASDGPPGTVTSERRLTGTRMGDPPGAAMETRRVGSEEAIVVPGRAATTSAVRTDTANSTPRAIVRDAGMTVRAADRIRHLSDPTHRESDHKGMRHVSKHLNSY